jgi:hypothetical protein
MTDITLADQRIIPCLDDSHPGLPPAEIIKRIEEALERDGTHTWDDVKEMLVLGEAQIFFNDHGCWITEIMISPRRRWLNVWVIAGQLPEVMEIQERVEQFCLTKSLERMIAITRPGWVALSEKPGWEKFGWKQHGFVLKRDIEGV